MHCKTKNEGTVSQAMRKKLIITNKETKENQFDCAVMTG